MVVVRLPPGTGGLVTGFLKVDHPPPPLGEGCGKVWQGVVGGRVGPHGPPRFFSCSSWASSLGLLYRVGCVSQSDGLLVFPPNVFNFFTVSTAFQRFSTTGFFPLNILLAFSCFFWAISKAFFYDRIIKPPFSPSPTATCEGHRDHRGREGKRHL